MQGDVFILIACFNEGKTIISLLQEVEYVLKDIQEPFCIVVIDDGSSAETVDLLAAFQFSVGHLHLKILRLDYNRGHQAAIEQGILFAFSSNAKHAILLDGDGEDDPAILPELLKRRTCDIVHVTRGRRGEGLGFQFGYVLYKMIFRIITKKKMNFGNYGMISYRVMELIHYRTFYHLAAFLSKLNLPVAFVKADRRPRISGKSKMRLSGLIQHGFRSFVEYAEELVMIFLKLSFLLFFLFILTMAYIVYLKYFTDKAILGWTSTLGIGLLTAALLCVGFFTMGVLLVYQSHARSQITPRIVFKIVR